LTVRPHQQMQTSKSPWCEAGALPTSFLVEILAVPV